jgi:hypothetical protein
MIQEQIESINRELRYCNEIIWQTP